jgi:DNA-binding response OmpR family regulator
MKIFLIEDDKGISDFLSRGLKEEGYAVDAAFDGNDGLRKALQNDYNLVILDIMLPGKDGFEVCREIRRSKHSLPILMLTGRADTADILQGLNAGADDYVTKPFSFDVLAARVKALLRRAEKPVQTELEAGPLLLNRTTRQVSLLQIPLALTAREYALLEFLLLHADMLITHTALEQNIWNQEFEGNSNMVEVYISRLRGKLGADGENLIQTVHGAGYRLVKP